MQKHILYTAALLLTTNTAQAGLTGNSQPPLAGFTPYVAITTSNKTGGPTEQNFASHTVHHSYVGSHLDPTQQTNYTIGVFDTGAVADILSYPNWNTLGINSSHQSGAYVQLSGVSGAIDTPISNPIGVFTQGLQSINTNGSLNESQLVGHGNTSAILLNQNAAGNGTFQIPSIVGQPLLSFFTTEIKNDTQIHVNHQGKNYQSPQVLMHNKNNFTIPESYKKNKITLNYGDAASVLPPNGASFQGDFSNLDNWEIPQSPTTLSYEQILPTASLFKAETVLYHGDPNDPTNNPVTVNLAVDTGAQATFISSAIASSLNLPLTPDFTLDVGGVGGINKDVPGYYIDYLRINGQTAVGSDRLEFNKIPVLIIDLPGGHDGVIGMNLFWDRNIVFDPNIDGLGTPSTFWVSDPVLLKGDTDLDGYLNQSDLDNLKASFGVEDTSLTGQLGDTDGNATVDLLDLANLRNNFGKFASGSQNAPTSVAIPEPTALYVLFVTAAALTTRKNRNP